MSVTPGSADYENQRVRTPNRVSGTHRFRWLSPNPVPNSQPARRRASSRSEVPCNRALGPWAGVVDGANVRSRQACASGDCGGGTLLRGAYMGRVVHTVPVDTGLLWSGA
jgi:hypothetical protein